MSMPCLKKVDANTANHSEARSLDKPSDGPDVTATLIVVMTVVFMTIGFSIAFGLSLAPGVVVTAFVSIGYTGVVLNRRGRRPKAKPNGTLAATPLQRRAREMHITLHTPDTIYAPRHIPSWLSLACAAGAVNGFAFLSCEEFVSHITGTSTRIGLEWHHLGLAAEYALVLASFVIGAIASVIWLQARACRGKRPRWANPLRAVALILAGVAIAGHAGYFGPFDGQVSGNPPFILLSMLAFAMGLQNAAVASTTGLSVRTTHLTGPATDLGIHLGTACFASGEEQRDALKGAGLRLGKIVAFVTGAGLALPLAERLGYLTLLAPASLVSIAVFLSFLPDWSPSDFRFQRIKGDGNTPVRP